MNSVDNVLVDESRGGRVDSSVVSSVNSKCIGQKKERIFPIH